MEQAATAVHPRHGFWYKVGFTFAIIFVLGLVAIATIIVSHAIAPTATLRFLNDLTDASFLLGTLSFFIDSVQFRRPVWIAIDGVLVLLALYLTARLFLAHHQ